MKNRNIALVSAFALAATLVAPMGLAGPASAASTEAAPSISTQATASALPYDVGSKTVFLHGEFSITFTPAKYATFQVQVVNSAGQVVSNLSYSGSSPHTITKNDVYLGGYHTFKVTSNVQGAGTFYLNPSS